MPFSNHRLIFYKTAFVILSILLSTVILKSYTTKIKNEDQSSKTNISKDIAFDNIAVIVEFRLTPLLVTVILNVIQNIPEHWPIQIFHCQSNNLFIRQSHLSKYIANKKIILTELAENQNNFRGFTNSLLTNISFWQLVRGEKVLFFQLDSVMCSNSPHKITDYLQYDYIGAPWAGHEPRVGNGGFSLRSRNKSITLIQQTSNSSLAYKGDMNEDVWYSMHMSRVGSVAPVNVSKTFSVESIFYENPLGVHKMGISSVELKKLCDACPEARLIPPFCR